MIFNLIFFRATLSNLMILEPEDEDSRWSFSQLPAIAVGVIMVFANIQASAYYILLGMRIMCLRNMLIPITREILRAIHDTEIADQYNNFFEEENTDPETPLYAHLRTSLRLLLETLVNVNPPFGVVLKILLHSMIIKSVFHAIATFTHFGKSVESLIEVKTQKLLSNSFKFQSSPEIEGLSITSLNSSGLALLNISSYSLHEFVEMQYFGDYMPSTIFGSIVLITTDSLFSVFAVAYFLSGPGVWLGVSIQTWLGNGAEPNDPEERGQRMGQFLGY